MLLFVQSKKTRKSNIYIYIGQTLSHFMSHFISNILIGAKWKRRDEKWSDTVSWCRIEMVKKKELIQKIMFCPHGGTRGFI